MIFLKKIIIISFLFFLTFVICNNNLKLKAEDALVKYGKSAIVIELDTADVLYEYNADNVRNPASTTKIMTIKLVFDAIRDGKLKYDQVLITSDYAASMGGSQIFLESGEKMTVRDLLKAVVIASANDASVVLAEAICGTEDLFVKKMNDEAKKLGMVNTNYLNVTGLHEPGHVSSARDLSLVARKLISDYEDEIIPLSSTYEDYLRKDTNNPFWLVNTNKLIKRGLGIDGLKTGWTNEAGYCLVATKKENNMRVISVVMGADTPQHRNEDTVSLLNYAFSNYDKQIISPKGAIVRTDENILLSPSIYNIVLSKDISRIINKSSSGGVVTYELDVDKKNITGSSGTIIGKMNVYIDNKLYQTVDVELKEKVKKSSFIEILKNILDNIL